MCAAPLLSRRGDGYPLCAGHVSFAAFLIAPREIPCCLLRITVKVFGVYPYLPSSCNAVIFSPTNLREVRYYQPGGTDELPSCSAFPADPFDRAFRSPNVRSAATADVHVLDSRARHRRSLSRGGLLRARDRHRHEYQGTACIDFRRPGKSA